MSGGARALFWFAMTLLAVACAIALIAARPSDASGALLAVEQLWSRAFGGAMWSPLVPLTAASGALALVLLLLDGGQSRVPTGGAPAAHAGALGLREALQQAGQRIAAALEGPKPRVIEGFNELLRGALAAHASDIHVSPGRDGVSVTYRVDGALHEVVKLPLALGPRLAIRAKVLAGLDTQGRPTALDGRVVAQVDGQEVDARMSSLPTETGERIVLRLMSGGRSLPTLDSLGYPPELTAQLRELAGRAQGLFFVTGVVGGGKTTTLYATLHDIATQRGKTTSIVTLEDPIELQLPFAVQTRINARTGVTFAASLRSVLRQDPNVLMVGEIRDRETADIAVQAAMTGHLILTTVHSDTAAGPFARLVRKLCTACRREAPPDAIVCDTFARHGVALPKAQYFEPVGCDYCEKLGYAGRVPIAELLVVDDEIRKAIHDRRPTNEIHHLAVTRGMTTLLADGVRRASAGETSLAEVLRVAG
jgi:general secretion pathway protein E